MINISKSRGFDSHRSGWSYVLSGLKMYHSDSGIFVNDFIERSFSWEIIDYHSGQNSHKLPYTFPWVGFLHNPHNMPRWFDYQHSPQAIFSRTVFQKSLEHCKCLITLSNYLGDWVKSQTDIPVITLKHPTYVPTQWKPYDFVSGPRNVIQVGYWLRKFESIANLKLHPMYHKKWMPGVKSAIWKYNTIKESMSGVSNEESKIAWKSVEVMEFLDNKSYDEQLSTCVMFLDLYDTSANTAVVDAIGMSIPLVINRLPATEEYLGVDYPLFFTDLKHAEEIIQDVDLILSGHEYLKNLNKDWVSKEYFAANLVNKLGEII
jgi:hypothetical protein